MKETYQMTRVICIALMTVVSLWCISPCMAEMGVTDSCQDDVRGLEDKIKDSKDDYTAESRREAKRHLMAAKANRLNPAKCRSNVLKAREALRKGKQGKKGR